MKTWQLSKIVLPSTVISVIAMILLPLPHQLMDVLLAANFAFCVILLLSSLFVTEPDRFTTLPTILLLSTLFRLGLNISSTRLILSGGEVPTMIISFGEFVVAGSLIVGLVIFGIISIIQFIVIAKGSERVAEVAARFTLDALPGKQMSIDADMRAGLLSISEAREKRRELHRESKLYGALDGAMKFVKGDAIVGLCIIFVNVIAGFLVGVFRDGVSFSEAVSRYTLLTIGDGLSSQIPAVLVSVAAGIIVTRVSEKEGGVLADEIGSQITREPTTLLLGSIVLFGFALLPGLPFIPFLIMSSGSLYVWHRKQVTEKLKQNITHDIPFKPRILPILTLRLSPKGASQLQNENRIASYYEAIRSEYFDEMGIVLPDLCFDIDPKEMLITGEIVIAGYPIFKTKFLPERVIQGCSDAWSRCLASAIKEKVIENLNSFLTESHSRTIVDLYENRNIDSIRSLIPDKISITGLTLLFKSLLNEGISIRDFSQIADALSESFEDLNLATDSVRAAMTIKLELYANVRKKLIRNHLLKIYGGNKSLICGTIEPELENSIVTQVQANLPLHPQICETIKKSIFAYFDRASVSQERPIIIVPSLIRLAIYNVVRDYQEKFCVLSYEEFPSDFTLKIENLIGEVELSEAA